MSGEMENTNKFPTKKKMHSDRRSEEVLLMECTETVKNEGE